MFDFCAYFIICMYVAMIVCFYYGWKRIERFPFQSGAFLSEVRVSVVVAFRNEAHNLPMLVECLKRQTYKNVDFWLVNDHSTDDWESVLARVDARFHIINSEETGKKSALKLGISQALGEVIICTDADCAPQPTWVECVAKFQHETAADMILAPTVMTNDGSFFRKLQSLEFMSLQATTAGAAGCDIPFMCNGSNLAFTKSAWTECSENQQKTSNPSGDDVFLLNSFYRSGKSILFLKSQSAVVFTPACVSIGAFFRQRMRWSSKTTINRNMWNFSTALVVFLTSVLVLLTAILTICHLERGAFANFFFNFAMIFVLKLLVDRIFLSSYSIFSKETYLTILIFPASLLYPFYVVVSAIGGLFWRGKWK